MRLGSPEPNHHRLTTHVAEFSTVHLIPTSSQNEHQIRRIRLTFLEVSGPRLGFGLGLKTTMHLIRTPYVLIAQHDWVFTRTVPLTTLLDDMNAHLTLYNTLAYRQRRTSPRPRLKHRVLRLTVSSHGSLCSASLILVR